MALTDAMQVLGYVEIAEGAATVTPWGMAFLNDLERTSAAASAPCAAPASTGASGAITFPGGSVLPSPTGPWRWDGSGAFPRECQFFDIVVENLSLR